MKFAATILVFFALVGTARAEFRSSGGNVFLTLQPNDQWVYEGVEKGIKTRLVVTVLEEVETINGVETRVVEEKRTAAKVATTQRSHLAINSGTNDVCRFEEVVSVAVPASPRLGQKLGEKSQVVSLTEAVKVPAGSFINCLKITRDGVVSLYARDVGAVQIGELKLIRHGQKKIDNPKQTATLDAEPIIPMKMAREAMGYVGADPQAEEVWLAAINDPALPAHDRSDLIEDLNESGFSDGNGKHPTAEDLPMVLNRIAMIEQLAPDAMDQVNYDAFAEAYKDLVNIANRLGQQ